jgi:hypothetical protein
MTVRGECLCGDGPVIESRSLPTVAASVDAWTARAARRLSSDTSAPR